MTPLFGRTPNPLPVKGPSGGEPMVGPSKISNSSKLVSNANSLNTKVTCSAPGGAMVNGCPAPGEWSAFGPPSSVSTPKQASEPPVCTVGMRTVSQTQGSG